MDMSFREKSAIGSLVLSILLFVYFFRKVIEVLVADSSDAASDLPVVMLAVVATFIAVEIAYHILLAIDSKPPKGDERDALIEAKAIRIAYFVLAGACITIAGHAMLATQFSDWMGERGVAATPAVIGSFLALAFILSEIIGLVMQLYYYRRGV